MFIIPCKYSSISLVEKCVASIRQYHPTARILVVDSNSDDKSYFETLKPYNVEIADVANNNYELGAFWYAVKNYKDSHYVLVQDSIQFKKSIDELINTTEMFRPFMWFVEPSMHNFNHIPADQWLSRMNEFLGDFMKLPTDRNVMYLGSFGTNFIASDQIVQEMLAKRMDLCALPESKSDSWITERISGIVATQCGVDIRATAIVPQEYHEIKSTNYNHDTGVLDTEYFVKTFCYRQ